MKFLSNDYTNPNTNPKTLTTLTLTLTDPHNAFESFCAPIFGNYMRNYFLDWESEYRTPRHFVSRQCFIISRTAAPSKREQSSQKQGKRNSVVNKVAGPVVSKVWM